MPMTFSQLRFEHLRFHSEDTGDNDDIARVETLLDDGVIADDLTRSNRNR